MLKELSKLFKFCYHQKRMAFSMAKKTKITSSRTAVEPHAFKVKEYDISLTKNYCITINIQKASQFINSFLRYSKL